LSSSFSSSSTGPSLRLVNGSRGVVLGFATASEFQTEVAESPTLFCAWLQLRGACQSRNLILRFASRNSCRRQCAAQVARIRAGPEAATGAAASSGAGGRSAHLSAQAGGLGSPLRPLQSPTSPAGTTSLTRPGTCAAAVAWSSLGSAPAPSAGSPLAVSRTPQAAGSARGSQIGSLLPEARQRIEANRRAALERREQRRSEQEALGMRQGGLSQEVPSQGGPRQGRAGPTSPPPSTRFSLCGGGLSGGGAPQTSVRTSPDQALFPGGTTGAGSAAVSWALQIRGAEGGGDGGGGGAHSAAHLPRAEQCSQLLGYEVDLVDDLDQAQAAQLDPAARFPVVLFANGRRKLVVPVEFEKEVRAPRCVARGVAAEAMQIYAAALFVAR